MGFFPVKILKVFFREKLWGWDWTVAWVIFAKYKKFFQVTIFRKNVKPSGHKNSVSRRTFEAGVEK